MTVNSKSRTRSETMRWKILLIFAALLFSQNIFGQSIMWQRTYHALDNNFGYKILPAPDNCFYFAGYIDNIISSYCYVLKLNQLGDTIWSKRISGGLYSAALSHDSCCVIANFSDTLQIIKIDRFGNIIWNRNMPIWFICLDIQPLSDNGFILSGNFNLAAVAIRINSNGEFTWSRIVDSYQSIFYSGSEGVNGNLVFVGGATIQGSNRVFIYNTDNSGNLIWQKTFSFSPTFNFGKKIVKTHGSYYVGGNTDYSNRKTFLIEIDTAGNLLQTRIWTPYGTSEDFFEDMAIVEPGKLVLSKTLDSSSNSFKYAKAQLIDFSFNLIKEKVFLPSFGYANFSSILPLANKDILFAGSFDYNFTWYPNRVDMYAVRTDSNLNTSPFPPIGITTNNQNSPEEYVLHQNYPNPFNPKTTISFSLAKSGVVKIKILDITGKVIEVKTSKFYNAGNHKFDFQANNLSSGIYFYQLIVNDQIISTKKMVLLK